MTRDHHTHEYSRVPVSEEQAEAEAASNDIHDDIDQADPDIHEDGLPIVADTIPATAWLIAIVEAGEKFAFFGIHGPLQNYIQLSPKGGLRRGGLGLGQKSATTAKLLFTIWGYVTPLLAAVIADQYLGRYRTIMYSTIPYIAGLAILTGSALFVGVESSKIPILGVAIAMFTIGIGTGGIKAGVAPLVAEQYSMPEGSHIQVRNGRQVRIDYAATIQRIFLLLYMLINFGAFGALATAAIEQEYGFVPAYGLSLVVFVTGTVVLLAAGRFIRKTPPLGSVLPTIFRILKIAISRGFKLDSAKPENLDYLPPWDAQMVDQVRQALYTGRVFIFLPFWFCSYTQIITNLISQAGTMRTGSIPNDILVYSDSLTVIIITPIFDRVIYPFLQGRGIHFTPLRRMAIGFFFCALAMAYATVLQSQIYLSPPCYDFPLAQHCKEGQVPNDIHVLWQIPVYLLVAVSEIFTAATSVEFAYASAPKSMKSLITALYTFTVAAGILLAMIFQRIAEDPHMTWFYGSLTLEVLIGGILFCYTFRNSLRSGTSTFKLVD